MSSKKEEKADAAADRIKAAAMSAAKGLSRAQAERAAAAAARNVNAYGQKEEGPSRWQERKEAKRQMYLMSTEKAVRLGERKDLKSNMSSVGGLTSQCQKCFQPGHWTYECKNERVYISRPSRSQILKNPKLRQKMMSSYNEDNPDVKRTEVEEEEREEKEEKKKPKKKSKRKHRSDTESSSDSEASDSGSDSRSSSATGSDYSSDSALSYSSSSDSEDERKRSKRSNKKQKGRRKRYSSSSEPSDSESSSDSDSGKKQKSKKKHSRRR
ncbi:Halomucin [Bienertia sinuspersici]